MYKRKPIKGMLKSADHNPVKVGDNIIFIPEYKVNGPKKPKKPSKLDLILKRLDQIDTNQQDTNSRLERLETEVKGINTRIDNLVKVNDLKE